MVLRRLLGWSMIDMTYSSMYKTKKGATRFDGKKLVDVPHFDDLPQQVRASQSEGEHKDCGVRALAGLVWVGLILPWVGLGWFDFTLGSVGLGWVTCRVPGTVTGFVLKRPYVVRHCSRFKSTHFFDMLYVEVCGAYSLFLSVCGRRKKRNK